MKKLFVLCFAAAAFLVSLRYHGVATNVVWVDNAVASLMAAIGIV